MNLVSPILKVPLPPLTPSRGPASNTGAFGDIADQTGVQRAPTRELQLCNYVVVWGFFPL